MPLGDRTGPLGMGPRTGRGGGYCSGFNVPGYQNPGVGFGFGGGAGWGGGRGFRGGGFGRGFRNRFWATGLPSWVPFTGPAAPSTEAEKQSLEQQASALQSQLDGIRKRLDELMGKDAGTS